MGTRLLASFLVPGHCSSRTLSTVLAKTSVADQSVLRSGLTACVLDTNKNLCMHVFMFACVCVYVCIYLGVYVCIY